MDLGNPEQAKAEHLKRLEAAYKDSTSVPELRVKDNFDSEIPAERDAKSNFYIRLQKLVTKARFDIADRDVCLILEEQIRMIHISLQKANSEDN